MYIIIGVETEREKVVVECISKWIVHVDEEKTGYLKGIQLSISRLVQYTRIKVKWYQ